MTVSLSQLFRPKTEAEALAWALEELADLGFNTTSWQSGSVQLTFVRLVAKVYSLLTESVASFTALAYNETAEDDALTAFSDSVFDNQRNLATRTEGELTLTAAAGQGPFNIVAQAYLYQHDTLDLKYRNLTSGSVVDGTPLVVTIQAESAGAAYNVANNSITTQLTPIAGMTVTNNAIAGSTTWVSSEGTDEETDPALRIRNTSRWATLSYAAPWEAYVFWAREASVNIARVAVDDTNPDGPGTLYVYIAGASGVSSGDDRDDAQDLIDTKQPETSVATVFVATAQPQTFTANVYVDSDFFDVGVIQADKEAEIEAALTAHVNGLDIGGVVLPPPDGDGVQGYLLADRWRKAVQDVVGVENIGSESPAADVAITAFRVMTMDTITFTYVPIDV